MRATACCCLVLLLVSESFADSPDPPLENKRLPISTLIREDIFAGWRQDDMERFTRGEKNIELLLEQRPHAKVELLAWKGGTKLYRAVVANEAGNEEEFQRLHEEALELFAEAKKAGVPQNFVVSAVTGGSYALFADRLPEELRDAAWEECWDNYQVLWSQQGPVVEKLPLHIKGELLAGIIQSARAHRAHRGTGHVSRQNDRSAARHAVRPHCRPLEDRSASRGHGQHLVQVVSCRRASVRPIGGCKRQVDISHER